MVTLKENNAKKSYSKSRTVTEGYIKFLVKENLNNEIARALIKTIESPYMPLKLFLIVTTLSATCLSSYLALETLFNYFDYGVSTTLRTVYETPTQFPQIKICNINPFTTEASFDYLKKINSMYFPGVDIFNQSQMSNLTYDERRSLVWRIYLLATSKMNDASFSESD